MLRQRPWPFSANRSLTGGRAGLRGGGAYDEKAVRDQPLGDGRANASAGARHQGDFLVRRGSIIKSTDAQLRWPQPDGRCAMPSGGAMQGRTHPFASSGLQFGGEAVQRAYAADSQRAVNALGQAGQHLAGTRTPPSG